MLSFRPPRPLGLTVQLVRVQEENWHEDYMKMDYTKRESMKR